MHIKKMNKKGTKNRVSLKEEVKRLKEVSKVGPYSCCIVENLLFGDMQYLFLGWVP